MNYRLQLVEELVQLEKSRLSQSQIDEIVTNYLWARHEYKHENDLIAAIKTLQ